MSTMTATQIDVTYSEIERDQMRDNAAALGSGRFVITGEEFGMTPDGTEWTARLVHDSWTDNWVVALDDPDYEDLHETYESQSDATDAWEAHVDRYVEIEGAASPEWLSEGEVEFDFDGCADFGWASEY